MNFTAEHARLDPYAVLDISYNSTEQEIQQAFQAKIAKAPLDLTDQLLQAYGMVRNQQGRHQFRFDDIRSCLATPYENTSAKGIDIAALARELAFLSPWELGDDSCLN